MKFKDVEIDEENASSVFVGLVQSVSLLAYNDNDFILMERIELADYSGVQDRVDQMYAQTETEFTMLQEQFVRASDNDCFHLQVVIQINLAKQRDLRLVLDTFEAYIALTGELPTQSLSNLMREVDAKQKASLN